MREPGICFKHLVSCGRPVAQCRVSKTKQRNNIRCKNEVKSFCLVTLLSNKNLVLTTYIPTHLTELRHTPVNCIPINSFLLSLTQIISHFTDSQSNNIFEFELTLVESFLQGVRLQFLLVGHHETWGHRGSSSTALESIKETCIQNCSPCRFSQITQLRVSPCRRARHVNECIRTVQKETEVVMRAVCGR